MLHVQSRFPSSDSFTEEVHLNPSIIKAPITRNRGVYEDSGANMERWELIALFIVGCSAMSLGVIFFVKVMRDDDKLQLAVEAQRTAVGDLGRDIHE